MPFRIAQEAVEALLDKVDCLGCVHEIEGSRGPYGRLRINRGDKIKFAENNPLWGLDGVVIDVDDGGITAILGKLKVRLTPDQIGTLQTAQNGSGETNGRV